MKVMHLYDGHEKIHRGKGSLPRIIWNIATRTVTRGHEVTILERQWDGLPQSATHDGVHFRRLDLRTGSSEPWTDVPYEMVMTGSGTARLAIDRTNFALQSLPLLSRADVDIVHCYLPFAANVLVTIAPWFRSRMVYTAQLGELRLNSLSEEESTDLNAPGFLKRFSPDIFLAKRVAKTTVLNENVENIFSSNGIPSDKLAHVPNGVDIDKVESVPPSEQTRVREDYHLSDDPIVLFVGTVMPRKGVTHLVEAVGKLSQENEGSVQLVIAGETTLDDTYFEEVQSIISEYGIGDLVTFTGYLDDEDLLPLYGLSDVFVLPSFEEGFGMVVSEAMAAGTPVIGSNISGIRQQIDEGETGLLVQPGNPDALREGLSTLLGDDRLRESMGERSKRKAQQFSWETVTDDYLTVYDEVAGSESK